MNRLFLNPSPKTLPMDRTGRFVPALGYRLAALLTAVILLVGADNSKEKRTPSDVPKSKAVAAPRDGSEFRVLFVGNSLTEMNDLASMVRAMASAGGVKVRATTVNFGNYSLEDHWRNGSAQRALASGQWDYLVLQQGPSSRPESQVHLRNWAVRWADEARRHGATPALYMVWPFEGQKNGFQQVSQSYRSAAKAGKARILPAGDAWQEALRIDPALGLYLGDRLHPTPAGSYLAALVITQELTGVKPRSVPARLKLASGQEVVVPEAQVEKLRNAADKVHIE